MGALIVVLVGLVVVVVAVFALSRPAGTAAPSQAPTAPATGATPPAGLAPGQTWAGDLSVTGSSVVLKGTALRDVDVKASNLRTGSAGTTMGSLELQAVVPFSELAKRVGGNATVGYRDAHHITIRTQYTALDRAFDVNAVASVAGEGRDLLVTPTSLQLGDSTGVAGQALAAAASKLIDTRRPIPGLPEGLEVTGTTVTPNGLAVTLAGTDVTLN